MDELIFFINKVVVSGLITGCVYALGGIGVTLIFGTMRFAHFAHGDMMTMGAFLSFVLAGILQSMGVVLPIPLGFAVMPVAMGITAIIALGLFGIEEASVETEDPFGRGENCLDMETFTLGIARDAGQMAATQSAMAAIGLDGDDPSPIA